MASTDVRFGFAMDALLHSLVVQLVVAVGIFPAIVKVFSTVEESLSEQAKQKISSVINKLDQVHVPGDVPKVSSIFEQVFGPRHLSLKCIYRVAIVASVSYLLVGLSVVRLEPETYAQADALKKLAALLLLINFPSEYVGLLVTRAIVQRLESSGDLMFNLPTWVKDRMHARWGKYEEWRGWDPILFLADCYWKLAWTGLFYSWGLTLKHFFGGSFLVAPTYYHDPFFMFRQEDSAAMVLAVSVLLSSLWIWIYVFVLRNLKNVYKVVLALRWTLDFEKRPLKSVGVITAAICSVLYFCILLGTKLILQS
jgi:hypothetical protein